LLCFFAQNAYSQGIQFNGNLINFLNGPTTMTVDVGNRKVGINNASPLHTLDVTGTINATSNIFVNGVPISPYTPPYIFASGWVTSPNASVDEVIDGTCVRSRIIPMPELTAAHINGATVTVYMRVGSIGPYLLPYISDAGSATNQIHWVMNTAGQIKVYRHTFNTCRFNSGIAEAYPGQPVLVNLPQSLEYRVVIIKN
jgi:hypothetical protein